MVRPETYMHAHTTLRNIPYICGDDPDRIGAGGVLHRGATVWTRESRPEESIQENVLGFVEGVGLITLNSPALRRADVLSHTAA